MQDQETKPVTPEARIVNQAKTWRRRDRAAIANKSDVKLQRQEYNARRELRRVIDDAGVN